MNLPVTRHTSRAKRALLRQIPDFANCSDKELDEIAQHLDEATVPAGTTFVHEGALAHEAFIILEGWAAVMIHGYPVAALGPGQLAGEVAMIDQKPRSATVVAKTDMRMLVVGPDAFATFASQPSVARTINRTLATRLRDVDERLADGSRSDSTTRL